MAGPTPERPRQTWQSSNHYFIDPEGIASKVISRVRTELKERADEQGEGHLSETSEVLQGTAAACADYFPTVPLSEHAVLTGGFKHLLVHRRPKGSDDPYLHNLAIQQANDAFFEDIHGDE